MVHFGKLATIAWPAANVCHQHTVDQIERKGSELRAEEKEAIMATRTQPGMSLQRFSLAASAISEHYASILHDAFSRS